MVKSDGKDVMVVAFRGTTGSSEWAEYIKKFGGKPAPIDGGADRGVYSVWTDNLDKVSRPHLAHACTLGTFLFIDRGVDL